MLDTNADVVEMRMQRRLGPIKIKASGLIPQTIEQPQLFEDYFYSFFGINILSVNLWGKLYSLDLFKRAQLKPSGFKMGEDLIMNMKLFPLIRRYSISDYHGYNYRVGGLTSGYNQSLWPDLKKQYFIKRDFLFETKYEKALRPLNIELKNILLSSIEQRIVYLKESDNKLKQWINTELEDKRLWQDISKMSATEPNPIYQLITSKDVDAIISVVKKRLHKQRWRRRIKRILIIINKIVHFS